MDKEILQNYVNLNTAKLLKDKGFDIPCTSAYIWNSESYELCNSFTKPLYFNREGNFEDYDDDSLPRISAPTLEVAKKFLEEEYGWCIDLIFNTQNQCYVPSIYNMNDYPERIIGFNGEFKKQEDVISLCIEYILLHLIK